MTAESDATGVALEAALGSVRIGVLTVDLDGYVRSSSPGLDRMFEAPVVVGTHVTELAPEEDADRIASVLSALADEGTDPDSLKRLRFGARKASGRTFPVMVNVERIEGSDLSVAVVRNLRSCSRPRTGPCPRSGAPSQSWSSWFRGCPPRWSSVIHTLPVISTAWRISRWPLPTPSAGMTSQACGRDCSWAA